MDAPVWETQAFSSLPNYATTTFTDQLLWILVSRQHSVEPRADFGFRVNSRARTRLGRNTSFRDFCVFLGAGRFPEVALAIWRSPLSRPVTQSAGPARKSNFVSPQASAVDPWIGQRGTSKAVYCLLRNRIPARF